MNLPNKLTMARIFISIIIIAILLFPFDSMGITTTKFFINESLVVDIKYLIAGVLFIIGSLTDFLDGYIARKYNLITDFGKLIDAIADKMLVNSVLIILASTGTINAIIPVVVILRDTVVNSIKMLAASKGKVVAAIKSGKLKSACLMTGITLTLFYNFVNICQTIKILLHFIVYIAISFILKSISVFSFKESFSVFFFLYDSSLI